MTETRAPDLFLRQFSIRTTVPPNHTCCRRRMRTVYYYYAEKKLYGFAYWRVNVHAKRVGEKKREIKWGKKNLKIHTDNNLYRLC